MCACDTSIESVKIRLEGDSHRLMQWFIDNDMKANPSNFQLMFLGRKEKTGVNFTSILTGT